jgi:hypothetical protein
MAGYPVSGSYRISGIRLIPDIRYPALGLAGYPAKTVSGAFLTITYVPSGLALEYFGACADDLVLGLTGLLLHHLQLAGRKKPYKNLRKKNC